MIKNIINNNKLAIVVLESVKENIITHRVPIYNPLILSGLKKEERYSILWRIFNKDFNQVYKGRYQYLSCKNLEIDKEYAADKDLIIIEDIDYLVNDKKLQAKVIDMINNCLHNNIQIILCSSKFVGDLTIDEKLKCRLKWGLILHLNN